MQRVHVRERDRNGLDRRVQVRGSLHIDSRVRSGCEAGAIDMSVDRRNVVEWREGILAPFTSVEATTTAAATDPFIWLTERLCSWNELDRRLHFWRARELPLHAARPDYLDGLVRSGYGHDMRRAQELPFGGWNV